MHRLKHFNTSRIFLRTRKPRFQALRVCRLQYKIRGFRTASDERARPGNEANVLYCAELAATFVVHSVGLNKILPARLTDPTILWSC